LPGGLKLALLPKKTRGGMVSVALTLRFGTEGALRGRVEAAETAGSLLMRGTRTKTRQQVQDAFDRLKARVGVGGGATSASASLEVPRENLAEALKLVAEVLREPAFDAKEFAQRQQERLASLEKARTQPDTVGSLAFQRAVNAQYPKGHPYYVPTLEEELEAIQATTLEEARAFHRDFYGASNGELGAVGDFDERELQALVEQLFGGWKSPAPYARVSQKYFDPGAQALALETPDKANAYFIAGQNLRLKDADPDYPALVLGNFVLGGGFLNSRLATRIRQKDGLSYGVGSSLSAGAMDEVGSFVAYAIHAPRNAGRLEAAMREELARVVQQGFTAEELEKARSGLLEYRQAGRSQDGSLARQLAGYLYLGRTLDFDAGFEARMAKLQPQDVQKALARHLDGAKLTVVKAGDFAGAQKGQAPVPAQPAP
jgi:zinc protease